MPSLSFGYTRCKHQRLQSDVKGSLVGIEAYNLSHLEEKLLKLPEGINSLNVLKESSYWASKDNKNLPKEYLLRENYYYDRVSVQCTEEGLIIESEYIFSQNNPLFLSIPSDNLQENQIDDSKSQNTSLLHLNLKRGGREESSLLTWTYILTFNISCLLISFWLPMKKTLKSLSHNGNEGSASLLI